MGNVPTFIRDYLEEFALPHEGGYTPPTGHIDPPTLFGVTQVEWEHKLHKSPQDTLKFIHQVAGILQPHPGIRGATTERPRSGHEHDPLYVSARNTALEVLYNKYIERPGLARFHPAIAVTLADFSINAGPSRAMWLKCKVLSESGILPEDVFKHLPVVTTEMVNNKAFFQGKDIRLHDGRIVNARQIHGTGIAAHFTAMDYGSPSMDQFIHRHDTTYYSQLTQPTQEQIGLVNDRAACWRKQFNISLGPAFEKFMHGWDHRINDLGHFTKSSYVGSHQHSKLPFLYNDQNFVVQHTPGNDFDASHFSLRPYELISVQLPDGIVQFRVDPKGRFQDFVHNSSHIQYSPSADLRMPTAGGTKSASVHWKDTHGKDYSFVISPNTISQLLAQGPSGSTGFFRLYNVQPDTIDGQLSAASWILHCNPTHVCDVQPPTKRIHYLWANNTQKSHTER